MGLQKGLIQIYTGEGKGKTTAALGLALRAVGQGLSVVIIQFLKGDRKTGERNVAARLGPKLIIRPMGRDGIVDPDNPSPEDIRLAGEALREIQRILDEKACDLLILDEVNVAVSLKVVQENAILKLMEDKPEDMELVLTGRDAPPSFIEKAHLVTDMKSARHYFDQGVAAREGIEF
jgi:cob(I)alamin adenosyltransferase